MHNAALTTDLRRRLRRQAMRRMLSQWQLYVLIFPAALYLLLFNYAPMNGVQIAFRDYRVSRGIWGSAWVGFKHFARFLSFQNFWLLVGNTLRISIYSFCMFPLAIILALMLNEVSNAPYKKFVQMVTYAPHFVSTVVVCSMLTLLFGRANGVANNVIEALGGERIAFLETPALFPSIYVWSDVWQNLGWSTIIYIAALSGVSSEQIEAARIDGANRLQVIWHVNVPAIMPTIIITLIMNCGVIFSVGFEKVYLLQNPLNLDASQVVSTYVYEIGLQGGQFSYSSAIGLFNTAINIGIISIVNLIAKRVSEISLW